MTKKNTKDEQFEDGLKELESILKQLESGKLGLQQSLEKFERGVKLYKSCKNNLEKAEKKIKILSESLSEEDFDHE